VDLADDVGGKTPTAPPQIIEVSSNRPMDWFECNQEDDLMLQIPGDEECSVCQVEFLIREKKGKPINWTAIAENDRFALRADTGEYLTYYGETKFPPVDNVRIVNAPIMDQNWMACKRSGCYSIPQDDDPFYLKYYRNDDPFWLY